MARARSVAVAGSISPALLAPSVTRTITLLRACERRRRVREVARPEPIAVPSGSISSRTSSSWRSSTAPSVVGGDLVRLFPAKATRPMRSWGRRFTNSATTSLATARRFLGWKSSAAMDPETSRATTMSTPRVVASSFNVPCWGRARASDPAMRPRAATAGGAWRRGTRRPAGCPLRRAAPGNTTARPWRSRRKTATSTSGPSRAAQSQTGSWKRKPAQSVIDPPPSPHRGEERACTSSSAPSCRLSPFRGRGLETRLQDTHETAQSGQVPLGLGLPPGPPRELDLVRGPGQVAQGRNQVDRLRARAEVGQHLRGRHLQDRRLEPPLEVALRDHGQLDVEGPVLAPGEAARRHERIQGAERLLVGSEGRDRWGGGSALALAARPQPEHETGDEQGQGGGPRPERAADGELHRPPHVRQLLLLLVLRQQRHDLERDGRGLDLTLGAVGQTVTHRDRRHLRVAEAEHGGLVAVEGGGERARGGGRPQLERGLDLDRERLPHRDLGLRGSGHGPGLVRRESGSREQAGNEKPAPHRLRSRALKKADSGFSYDSAVESVRASTRVRLKAGRVSMSAVAARRRRTSGRDASTTTRSPVSGSTRATRPTSGNSLSRGSRRCRAITSWRRRSTPRARS